MRRKVKEVLSGLMALAMTVTALPTGYLGVTAQAAETPVTFADINAEYLVDCGDWDVTTLSDGVLLGKNQSVTDRVYGTGNDVGGYDWGIYDTYGTSTNGSSTTGAPDTPWTWANELVGGDGVGLTVSNRYTKNQWESRTSFGDTRKLDYQFGVENGEYYVEAGFTDPWSCSKSPNVYVNYGKGTQATLAEPLTVANGKPATGVVTVDDGILSVNARAEGDDNKAINITYILIMKKAVYEKYYDIYKEFLNVTVPDTVKENFILPASKTSGLNVTWTSDDTDTISIGDALDGSFIAAVTRGTEDKTVHLTAKLQQKDVAVEKTFTVTVKKVTDSTKLIEIENFSMEDVLMTDAYYANAYDKEIEYLTSLDVDRFLAGFRETAAYAAGYTGSKVTEFMRNKTRYDGWEDSLIGGHTVGHYMSALAQAYANPQISSEDKATVKSMLDQMVDGMKECQQLTVGSSACEEGYLFGATLLNNTSNLEFQFDNVEANKTNIFTQAWVPWYTMHKILAGLVDAYRLTGNETALETAVNLGEWVYNRTSKWDSALQSRVLNIEYGGMNDCLYDLYAQIKDNDTYSSHNEHILAAAHSFDELTLYRAVKNGADGANILNNRHANTTIPKFIGALKRYIVLGADETEYLEYAERFWEMVLNNHSYVTGGNSENEHFGADHILYGEETNTNCETCNTYNMLKLTRELFRITGDTKYSDYYENTLVNAIMSSQNPETGMSMYFQPMKTGYHKVFGNPTGDFWCCTASGMENFTKLNDSIYFKQDDTVIVNQYISSELSWREKNIKLVQTSGIQRAESETAEFKVEALEAGTPVTAAKLALHIPDWAAGDAVIKVDGAAYTGSAYDFDGSETYAQAAAQGKYIEVPVSEGTTVSITIPMTVRAYNLSDNENAYAFKYGPVLLSAKLGTENQSEAGHGVNVRKSNTLAVASDSVALFGVSSVKEYMDNIAENLERVPGTLEFYLKNADITYAFVPHYSQYKESYGIYWNYYADADGQSEAAILQDKNAKRLERVLIDSVQAGYGQYEVGLEDNGTSVGSSAEHTRYAKEGGYFIYQIGVDETGDNYLNLTARRADNGLPLKVSVADTVLFDEILDDTKPYAVGGTLSTAERNNYYQIRIKLPQELIAANKFVNDENATVVKVKFEGSKDSESARVYNWSYMMRAYRTENSLEQLMVNGMEVTPKNGVYQVEVPAEDATLDLDVKLADESGYMTVGGKIINDEKTTKYTIPSYLSEVELKVYAEDFETAKTYKLLISKDFANVDYSENIVGYYNFDEYIEGIDTVQKASVPSVVDKTVLYEDGVKGSAAKLDGTFGLKFGSAAALGESYTISFWMKPSKLGSGVDPTFAAGVFSPEYWLSLTFDGKIWSKNGSYIETTASNAYETGRWQNVTLVVDGEKQGTADNLVTAYLYVDGELVSSGNIAKGIMTNNNAMLYFGVNAWDAYYQGLLDEVVLFNKTLSLSEIQAFADGVIDPSTGKEDVTKRKVTVFFDSDGGSETDMQMITTGSKLTKPQDPTKDGYRFLGWYNGTTAFDFDTAVTENMTLTAHWEKILAPADKVTVTYQAGVGGKITGQAVQTIDKGGKTTAVTAVADAGYQFAGWSDGVKTASRTDENVTASKTVTASFTKLVVAPTTTITLNRQKLTLGVGESYKLKATVNTGKKVTWSAGSKNATVSSKGVVKAKKKGTVTITATTEDGKKATCKITIKKAPKKISLNVKKKTLKRGKSLTLRVKFAKGCYSNKLTFTSSKKKVAKVSAAGKVTALKKGTTVITVKTYNGKKAKCKITVK